jgi:hypothetical protein
LNLLSNAFQQAFRDPKNDPWAMAEVSTWGSCQDPAKSVLKAVLKQTGETIGFGGFISSDFITAERISSGKKYWLEKGGRAGELRRWRLKELEHLRDQHVGGKNHFCKSQSSMLSLLQATTRFISCVIGLD